MLIHPTSLHGASLLELEKESDERSLFAQIFCMEDFVKMGLDSPLIQVNNSPAMNKGALSGPRYQSAPYEQQKATRCISGAIWHVTIDLRPSSPTYCQWHGQELTSESRKMMLIPKGCAEGYIALEEESKVLSFATQSEAADETRRVRWNDPQFNIEWPLEPTAISQADSTCPLFNRKLVEESIHA